MRLLRAGLLTLLVPANVMAQTSTCGAPGRLQELDEAQFHGIWALDLYLIPHTVLIGGDGVVRILGRVNNITASGRWQPQLGKCDPVTDRSLFELQQMFAGTPPNVSGGAAGGSPGPSGSQFRMAGLTSQVNNDVITGYIDRGDFTTFHAFRWTEAGRFTDLGTLDPANNAARSSFGTAISVDGSVIVGYSQVGAGTNVHAFRWTSAGMVDMGVPAGAQYDSRALGISDNGSVIVGDATFADNNAFTGFRSGAFRWTAAGGMQSLGALSPGFFSIATDVSADGATVVGQGGVQLGNSTGSRAFRWTSAGGLQVIGPLPGYTHTVATGVSDNGKVVVGIAANGPLSYSQVLGYPAGVAFRWTEAGGIQDLKALLVSKGFRLTGVTLVSATAITGDGQYIAGSAITPTTPAQETRPYLVKLCDAASNVTCTPFKAAPIAASFDFSTSGATSASALAGTSIARPLTVTPVGGFTQPVTFACAGLPSLSTCAFSPVTLTPGSAAVTTTLTISTTAPSRGGAGTLVNRNDDVPTSAVLVTVCVVLVLLRSRRRAAPLVRPVVVGVTALVLFSSCGGGDTGGGTTPPTEQPLTGGTPAGTYPVVVTATSGTGASAISRTLTFSLTVTR